MSTFIWVIMELKFKMMAASIVSPNAAEMVHHYRDGPTKRPLEVILYAVTSCSGSFTFVAST